MTGENLIGLIGTPLPHEGHARQLRAALGRGTDWDAVVALAGRHRLGPLLHWHLARHGLPCPTRIRRLLAGLYLRQRAIATVQTKALVEICRALRERAIGTVVLKGGALAHILYAEPALRPMDDLDILVAENHLDAARETLQDLGFHAPPATSRVERLMHHLPPATARRDGVPIGVEIHRSTMNFVIGGGPQLQQLRQPLLPYRVDGEPLHTLHPEEFLLTQIDSLRNLSDAVPAIRLADIIGWIHLMHDRIDWASLVTRHPRIRGSLAAIHLVSPLPSALSAHANIADGPAPALDMMHFEGWPKRRFREAAAEGSGRVAHLQQTVLPPQWWSRLVYGVPPDRTLAGVRLVHHPANLARQALWRMYLRSLGTSGLFGRRLSRGGCG